MLFERPRRSPNLVTIISRSGGFTLQNVESASPDYDTPFRTYYGPTPNSKLRRKSGRALLEEINTHVMAVFIVDLEFLASPLFSIFAPALEIKQ